MREENKVYNDYDSVEKDKKALERCLYNQKMQVNQKDILQQREIKNRLMAERETLLTRREDFLMEQNQEGDKTKIAQLREDIS